ncbi:MAG TPA: ATP-grasp domain-containing protein [Candidatus Eremiobacteraceae bacterium]|nr:ATP-grasp domain-containing protein [Candidatus Eremiobacteraceae bacterium]
MKPSVLIATTSRWFPTARLAAALASAGCSVDAVCPTGHPMTNLRGMRKIYTFRGLTALRSFAEAICTTRPDLIVPGDDLATCHLHSLYQRDLRRGQTGHSICALIERSLGSSESFPVVYARTAFIDLARKAGVRAPKTEVIANGNALKRWVTSVGLPTVLKANGTSGGDGVRVVHTLGEAEQAFRTLQAPPLLLRAIKRAVVDRDKTLLWPSLFRQRPDVNAQEFVPGREATSAVACWNGAVLASLHFEVISKRDAAGPSSVVRLIEHAEMSAAVETMVRQLKLSGLHGFDFMLEAHTGAAYLIEINPRATQVGHLTLGAGRDLPAALYSALSGAELRTAPLITENDTIALFPQEWMRDPESSFLQSAYHDVPWDEPELLRAFAGKRKHQGALAFQPKPVQKLAPVRLPRL